MKLDSLGANHVVSAAAAFHTVAPPSVCASPDHLRIAPPHGSTTSPRCFAYQAVRALGSFALKNTPPMPVIRAIGRYFTRLVIELRGLTKRYGTVHALRGVDATITGKIIGLLGPNGAGKS